MSTSEYRFTPKNFRRPLSTTMRHNPGVPDQPAPERSEVPRYPAYFDARYMAWRIRNPNHPLSRDKKLENSSAWPRQQRLDSCNLIQLYSHIEYLIVRYQCEYYRYDNQPKVLLFPNMFIEPQPGWQLYDETNGISYIVNKALKSKDINGVATFDGRVLLTTAGPAEDNKLVWIDPYGEVDGQCKLIRVMHQEAVSAIMDPVTPSSDSDVADIRGKPFAPVIGYSMARHEPGSVDRIAFGSSRELKPRLRYVINDPSDPNIVQRIEGWWMDVLVDFVVHAVGGKVADRLFVWLLNFFVSYTGVLKLLGVQEALYWGTKTDLEEKRTVYDLSLRRLQYYFRLEDIRVEQHPKFMEYSIAYQVLSDQDPSPWYTSEPDGAQFLTDTSGDPLYGYPNIGDDY